MMATVRRAGRTRMQRLAAIKAAKAMRRLTRRLPERKRQRSRWYGWKWA